MCLPLSKKFQPQPRNLSGCLQLHQICCHKSTCSGPSVTLHHSCKYVWMRLPACKCLQCCYMCIVKPATINSVLWTLVPLASPMQMKLIQGVGTIEVPSRCQRCWHHKTHPQCISLEGWSITLYYLKQILKLLSLTWVAIVLNMPHLGKSVANWEHEVRIICTRYVVRVNIYRWLTTSPTYRVFISPVCVCIVKITVKKTYCNILSIRSLSLPLKWWAFSVDLDLAN